MQNLPLARKKKDKAALDFLHCFTRVKDVLPSLSTGEQQSITSRSPTDICLFSCFSSSTQIQRNLTTAAKTERASKINTLTEATLKQIILICFDRYKEVIVNK